MPEQTPTSKDVDQFITNAIDTVPQLEALLLLWKKRPRVWSLPDLAAGLYIAVEETKSALDPLERQGLVTRNPAGEYSYLAGPHDALIAAVDETYRRELVRISRMIHSKAPSAVREFARAFMLRKDRD